MGCAKAHNSAMNIAKITTAKRPFLLSINESLKRSSSICIRIEIAPEKTQSLLNTLTSN